MSEILVTFGEIDATANDIRQSAKTIDQELADLQGRLNAIFSTWTGAASESYGIKQQQWNMAAADLKDVLNQIGNTLSNVNSNYAEAENSNKNRWA